MIAEITGELRDALRARGHAIPVLYEHERASNATRLSVSEARIVVDRDREAGDRTVPVMSQRWNPQMVAIRQCGVVVRIFARSGKSGARLVDHERACEALVDAVTVALYGVVKVRRTSFQISRQGYVAGDRLVAIQPEAWPGVLYELALTIDRAVSDTPAAEVTIGPGAGQVDITSTLDTN